MADSYIQVIPEDFAEKVLNSPDLVIVNFSSDQISACKIQDPEFEAISKVLHEQATFARMNVNEQNTLTRQWKVDNVPTMIFFKNGNEIYRITGIVMRDRLRRQVEGVLLAN